MDSKEWLEKMKALVNQMPRHCKVMIRFDDGETVTRTNFGFNAYELLGVHSLDSIDIAAQMHGFITPEKIKRFLVLGEGEASKEEPHE